MAGAAFFDLDKTLIEGSSAFHFGRAAYRAGMVSRRQLASDAWANLKFRLHGSTDAGTDELRERILGSIAGQRVVDLARMGPDVLSGILPLVYREVLDEAYAHQDAGRPAYIVTAASQELAEREGLDLSESFAYSDSESDLPMMRAVGHPVAVNPDRVLGRVAREEGWRIMRSDKLGRRLKWAAAVASVALVGSGGGYVAARTRRPARRRLLPRR